jgi:Ca2+/H+ antiporter, TMEM165/GDT1 family
VRPLASVPCTRVGRRAPCQGSFPARPQRTLVEAFFVSTLVVGLAEIGDKTQILSLMLAARFLRPVPIIFGILFATIANHAVAGLAGTFFGGLLSGPWTRWILGLSFLSVAVWALFPDKYEGDDRAISRSGAFTATLCAFFIAEIGDKTQIATIGLAARFEQFLPVVIGTTLGMMLANIPAVLIGNRIADKLPVRAIRIPVRAIRITAAVVFAVLGVLTIVRGDG